MFVSMYLYNGAYYVHRRAARHLLRAHLVVGKISPRKSGLPVIFANIIGEKMENRKFNVELFKFSSRMT